MTQMNKMVKRVLALVLALTMLMTMVMPALADWDDWDEHWHYEHYDWKPKDGFCDVCGICMHDKGDNGYCESEWCNHGNECQT